MTNARIAPDGMRLTMRAPRYPPRIAPTLIAIAGSLLVIGSGVVLALRGR